MQREEEIFRLLVENIRAGARMEFSQQQSRGECDFHLRVGNDVYPFEVTRYTDQRRRAMNAAILGNDGLGAFVNRRVAQNDWLVSPGHNANIRRVRAHVDPLLADIEKEGRTQFDVEIDYPTSPAVRAIWDEIRIVHGVQVPWSPPGRIGIATPGDSAILNGDQIVVAVEAEAGKEDNRRKLGVAAPERHLGVYVDYHGYPAHAAMLAGLMPPRAPQLPEEVTHVWVACDHDDPPRYLVWTYDKVRRWVNRGEFRITGRACD